MNEDIIIHIYSFLDDKSKLDYLSSHKHNRLYERVLFTTQINMKIIQSLNPKYFNQFTNVISFKFIYINNFFKLYWNSFKLIYHSFFFIYVKKLKFKGKGYYIFKNKRNTITFRFGYSHRLYLYFFKFNVKFLSKTSILLYGLNKNELQSHAFLLKNVRPYNLFTGKGIRFTRQIIYKKIGKASTYV